MVIRCVWVVCVVDPLFKLNYVFQQNMNRIICIEGGIGVGKSTLGRDLAEYMNHKGHVTRFYPEPFNQDFLEMFIGNMPRYAFAFQLYILTRRQLNYNDAQHRTHESSVIDRSLVGDYVFMQLRYSFGNVSDAEYAIYIAEYAKYTVYKPDVVIYLKVKLDEMQRRIESRGRDGEAKYELDYLDKLQKTYDVVLPQQISADRILTIEWNSDKVTDGKVNLNVLCDLAASIERVCG